MSVQTAMLPLDYSASVVTESIRLSRSMVCDASRFKYVIELNSLAFFSIIPEVGKANIVENIVRIK